MLHRLRSVLVRPGREQLAGRVEVDETFIGGEEPGLRGGRQRGRARSLPDARRARRVSGIAATVRHRSRRSRRNGGHRRLAGLHGVKRLGYVHERHVLIGFSRSEPWNLVAPPSEEILRPSAWLVVLAGAITFPPAELIHRIEREHGVIKVARQESREKKSRRDALRARAAAEEAVARTTSRVHAEVDGEFGEKRFLARLEELLNDRPYDVVDLTLHVPTVRGAAHHTPSLMAFDVVSTQHEVVSDFMAQIRELVNDNDLVWISDHAAG